MKSVVLRAVNQLELADVPAPNANPGQVVVALKAAALNHRDVWIKAGQYSAGGTFPAILGSDGAGVVSSIGEGVDPTWLGREVILNPALRWGGDPRAQSASFAILGMPDAGTFAEQIAIDATQLAPKPTHLSWEEAAALPLAGLTAYRALMTRARLVAGERVLITGIGGGVALFALQVALAAGARVWVTSSSPDKLARARSLGAEGGFLYSDVGWVSQAREELGGVGPAVIIDSVSGAEFDNLLELAAPGARIVFFGSTRGPVPSFVTRKAFWKQLDLLGTTMGSPWDWSGLMALVEKTQLHPIVSEVFGLDQAVEAFHRMETGAQFGKLVLRLSDS
jgi:zinc-binding alcohol dehydrogenase/oxidoreductase